MSGQADIDGLLKRIAAGEIADTVRLGAARGALPLPTLDLLRVQVYLATEDPSDEVRQTAAESLADRDAGELAGAMAAEEVPATVALYYARLAQVPEVVVEALAANRACPEAALLALAARDEAGVIERLLLNEVRLIECPEILGILGVNDGLSSAQLDRVAEVRLHFIEKPLPHTDPNQPALHPEVAAQVAAAIVSAEAFERDSPSSRKVSDNQAEEEVEAEDEPEKHAMFRIMDMNIAEKVKLAFLGSAEERALLLRDSNRVVSSSVLKSPRVSEKDVENYVKMRSLSEELIVMISKKRDWTRKYQVILGIVKHPKTPPRVTQSFLPRIQDKDIKNLTRDRNLPEMARQQVKRAYLARTQRKKR